MKAAGGGGLSLLTLGLGVEHLLGGLVDAVDVGLVVLAVVELHDFSADGRLEGGVVVREVGELGGGERHAGGGGAAAEEALLGLLQEALARRAAGRQKGGARHDGGGCSGCCE